MKDVSSEVSTDLNRYRQAADVAYKYAKSRLSDKEPKSDVDKEEQVFNENIKETEKNG